MRLGLIGMMHIIHHAWSKGGVDYTPKELATWLKTNILGKLHKARKNDIPDQPRYDVPTRKKMPVLGTQTDDIIKIDKERDAKREALIEQTSKGITEGTRGMW